MIFRRRKRQMISLLNSVKEMLNALPQELYVNQCIVALQMIAQQLAAHDDPAQRLAWQKLVNQRVITMTSWLVQDELEQTDLIALKHQLEKFQQELQRQLADKLKIVFSLYNFSRWDSLASIYAAATCCTIYTYSNGTSGMAIHRAMKEE